jgi:hypothetical protein
MGLLRWTRTPLRPGGRIKSRRTILLRRVSTSIPNPPTAERTAPEWPAVAAQLPVPDALWQRATGVPVTDHRTSWVRRVTAADGAAVFVKTYDYPDWRSRLRGLGKRTAPWASPRPHREFDALQWLRAKGLLAPRPLAVLVARTAGFVRRATLVTAAFPGRPASELLPELPAAERIALATAIVALVQRLHELGFRDRNLDLRNLLAAPGDGGWTVAKIDSPRHRIVAPGAAADRLTRADWRRLSPQLDAFGVGGAAVAAASR